MKISKLATLLLACGVLAACGGGGNGSNAMAPTSASVSGTVSGLQGGTLLLKNAGNETIAVAANGNFSFTKAVAEGSAYDVTILGQPLRTNCTVANGKGTVAHGVDSVSNVNVTCLYSDLNAIAFVYFNVGVTVSGLLPGNSVTFVNDGFDVVTANGNGLFVFPTLYATASAYGAYDVTVKTQPANQSCIISNGSGVGTDANNFVDILVSCK